MFVNSPFYRIKAIIERGKVPLSRELNESLERVLPVLKNEDIKIRPLASNSKPGGLLLLDSVPTVIIPDLHARIGLLKSLLEWVPPGEKNTVYQGLSSGKLQVVCVGDGFHAEARGIRRWRAAFEEFSGNYRRHKAIDAEMRESLGVMMIVMELKSAFPRHFHFLKGNHENIANEDSADNRAFRKFVYEGAMVAAWFHEFMGERTFKWYYEFEKNLPIFAVGDRFCITHAEPRRHYCRKEIIEALVQREIVFDFTWTANDEAEENSVIKYLEEYFPGDSGALMFGGHRPVSGNYKTRADGRYLQIHNPEEYIAAYISTMMEFSMEKNIIILPKKVEA